MMDAPWRQVTGYVLAGGQSSRMGRDKALLDNDGENLLQRALGALRSVCADAYILSGPRNHERDALLSCYAHLVPDAEPEHAGPVAGLLAALQHCHTLYACVVAVDQPAIDAHHLHLLLQAALQGGFAATCFQQADGKVDPLPVVMSTRLRSALTRQWQAGERRLLAVLQAATELESGAGRLLSLPLTMAKAPAHPSPLTNLNTPTDLESWRSTLQPSNQSLAGASE